MGLKMGHMLNGLTQEEREPYKNVGDRVNAFCDGKNLSSADFAALVGMGVPTHRVGDWRRGTSPSSVDVYRRIEHVLDFYGKEGYVQPIKISTAAELRQQDPGYTTKAISDRLQGYRHKEGGIPYGDIAVRLKQHGCEITTVQLAHYARGNSLPPPPTYLSLKAALDQLEGKPAAGSTPQGAERASSDTIDNLLSRL